MNTILKLALVVFATCSLSATAMINNSTMYTRLNSFSPLEGTGTLVNQTQNMLVAIYDFAVQGGAVSTVYLLDEKGNPAILPDNAIVQRVLVEVITAVTSSATATVALGAESTTDLFPATSKASLTLAAFLDGTPVDTAATADKLSADRRVSATIATTALTAGKIRAYIRYVLSE